LSVEVFIIDGVNSDVANVRKIAEIVKSINPDRIDINTAVRPPADSGVKAVSPEQLAELAGILGPKAEVTAAFKKQTSPVLDITPEALLGLIQRHPATAGQLARDFNAPVEAISKSLNAMVAAGKISAEVRDGETYFFHRAEK
jgi:wyosine [tRNA(Phe)-imidazoG37] synthetase (radical SAM superfamily)